MAFPSNTGTHKDTLESAWTDARGIAAQVKTLASQLSIASGAGPVLGSQILSFQDFIVSALVRLNQCAAVPGIGPYAQAQVNDNTLDVAASFTAMTTQIGATRDWVIANFPASGGFLQAESFNADGTRASRSFSSASLGGLRTQLASLLATID